MALETICSRRSIRKYTDEQVSRYIIEQIIDAGRVAPSAKNRQSHGNILYIAEKKKINYLPLWKIVSRWKI
jgi:nitroreductase